MATTPFGSFAATDTISQQRLDILQRDTATYNLSSLHVVARAGTPDDIKNLVKRGYNLDVDPTNQLDFLQAPIHQAALVGNIENVMTLIQLGTPVDLPDSKGRTALHYAAYFGHVDLIRVLIQNGASIDPTDEDKNTPLFLATIRANVPNTEQNFRADLSTSFQSSDSPIPDYLRPRNGASPAETIFLLLQLGSLAIDYQNKYGETPLKSAMVYNQLEVVEVLIRGGSRAQDIPDLNKNTPLHLQYYTFYSINDSFEYRLSQSMLNPDELSSRRSDMVEFLIRSGVQNLDPFNSTGETPFFMAAQRGWISVGKILLKYGSRGLDQGLYFASLEHDLPGFVGRTPLHEAIKQNETEMVKFLLQAGSQTINVVDYNMMPIDYVVDKIIRTEYEVQVIEYEEILITLNNELEELRKILVILRICGAQPLFLPIDPRSYFNTEIEPEQLELTREELVARAQQLMTEPTPHEKINTIRDEIYFQPLLNRVIDAIIE